MQDEFDVVVAGAGSAGCALVGRLVQANLKVCLVEAGPDYGPFAAGRWPQDLLDPQRNSKTHDWGYAESRAKVIGGCSTHNQCAALWPLPDDFDRWASLGNPGWSYAEIAPLIDQVEDDRASPLEPFHGHHGAIPTRPYSDQELGAWHRAFLQAAVASGFQRIADLSAPEPAEGIAPFHANVFNSTRWNAAFAFLDPVRGSPHLTILDRTLVDRLLMRQGTAVELICHIRGETRRLRARKFVLCAGTFGSPAILLRSGIGPAEHLRQLHIGIEHELPGVGQNLQDHPGVSVSFEPSARGHRAIEEDLVNGRFYENQANLRTRSRYSHQAYDLHLGSSQEQGESGEFSLDLTAYNMTPRSHGQVRLESRDPQVAPQIELGFLTDTDGRDLAVLLDALRLVRRLSQAEPLAGMIDRETEPGTEVNGESELENYIRENVSGYSHPLGTCKMGSASDPLAVVNAAGLVHGTQNVFVADASIIPQIPRANINLLCSLIGLRIANELVRH